MTQQTRSTVESELVARARRAHTWFRSWSDAAVAGPAGLYAHVVRGRVVGFGIEPVGAVIVDREGRWTGIEAPDQVLWGRVAAAAAAGVGAVAAAVGSGVVAHRHHR